MTLHWADFALMVVIVVAGFAATAIFCCCAKSGRSSSESQREMERRLTALTEAISMHEPRLAELNPVDRHSGCEGN